jgi:hypothetical protein
VENENHCISGPLMPFVSCTNTSDCPPGSHCQNIGAANAVCIGLCS